MMNESDSGRAILARRAVRCIAAADADVLRRPAVRGRRRSHDRHRGRLRLPPHGLRL